MPGQAASSLVHSASLVQPSRIRYLASSADISMAPSGPTLMCRPENVCTEPIPQGGRRRTRYRSGFSGFWLGLHPHKLEERLAREWALAGALTGGPFGFEDRSDEYPGAQTPKAGQTVILIDPRHIPGNRYVERIEGLFEAIAASGVERLPAERRYARREQSLRDGISVSDRDWAALQELLT